MGNKIIQINLSNDESLWRYMDIAKYLSLLSSKSLWLARPDTFKDQREGSFPESMKNELDIIYAALSKRPDFTGNHLVNNTEEFQSYLKLNTFISCWHRSIEESMIMWEIYGRESNSIAIKTKVDRLKSSFDKDETYRNFAIEIALDSVTYTNSTSTQSEQSYRQPYFIKREHFAFEREARLYIRSKEQYSSNNSPSGYPLQVDLSTLIECVYVHPDADDWFLNAVDSATHKYLPEVAVKRGTCGNTR
ncbi:hypothetical protein BCV44_04650 [Vibrio cyclitrophicus]|uniref:hypothetical protein n=1 Tax=Vibrio cyclitrophicus TaxID=47951 RepID=UPI000C8684DD|nr:hypothetical protein [Vibrio cyclitrophicus]PME09157.1 hypothetical protein BCV44_04650 [Vibrio cyclitrophicus]